MHPPQTIAHYRIVSKLGEGGMGTVFRATDTKLNRSVAIKLLSAEVADAAARQRFQREAEMASSLNHPHIVSVFDAGEYGGRQYLVTEFVEGGTLRQWASLEARTWRQIVELLIGVADALATAHAAGILHRDIKPDNILVSQNGYAKLADFGLAKLAEGSLGDLTRTLSEQPTRPGVLIGTIAYMSPEQAAGKKLDARSDIFSFGIVLYEMLSGHRPFSGTSDLHVLQTILHASPEPLDEHLPLALRIVVEKALEKDPSDRYQTMRDMVVDLRRLQRKEVASATPAIVATRAKWVPWLALLMLALGVTWREVSRPVTAVENPLANAKFTRLTNFEGVETDAAISPDGRFAAFLSDREGPLDVWITQIGSGEFVNITKGNHFPTRSPVLNLGFSGDGSQLWFGGSPGSRMLITPLMGGLPRPFLGDRAAEAAWSTDGTHLVYHTDVDGDPTFVAESDGADSRKIFAEKSGGHLHYPAWSMDGQWIYLSRGVPAIGQMDLWRIRASGAEPERLTFHNAPSVGRPVQIDARTLLYIAEDQDGSGPWLWWFDLRRKVSHRATYGTEQYLSVAVSADRQRAVATVANPRANLWTVPILDRLAEERDVKPLELPTVRALVPRFGGSSLFYLSSQGSGDGLWRFQNTAFGVSRNGQAVEIWKGVEGGLLLPPAISTDGRRVVFALRRQGKLRLHLLSADGTDLHPMTETIDIRGAGSWSPDGKWIIIGGQDAKGPGLFKIPSDGGTPVRLLSASALNPVCSPNGELIVYNGPSVGPKSPLLAIHSNGAPFEMPDIRVRVQGERFRFLPDGKGLVYMEGSSPSQDFWLLDLSTKKKRQLTRFSSAAAMRTFDITPDGTQIVFDRLQENSDIVLIDLQRQAAQTTPR